ncbi:MAG: TIM-barrel domain-containing protein [Armatimonadota bacterium]
MYKDYTCIMMRYVVLCSIAAAIFVQSPVAASVIRDGNKVTCGPARFEVLSPSLVRMQYAPGGFIDSATAVVTNRSMRDERFTVSNTGEWVRIDTKEMSVFYKPDSGKFTAANLLVTWRNKSQKCQCMPGSKDDENLGGPFGSFNDIYRLTAPGEKMPDFPSGMLSKRGYYLLDDSKTPVWDTKSNWIAPRTDKAAQDWYFFVYGNDYASFYKQYIALAGKIPMIPRYAFGAWVTDLNFEYHDEKIKEDYLYSIIERFRKEDIPLDVMVLDFGWHLYGWYGGLDWSPIISDPKKFADTLHKSGIELTLNDHPSCGLYYKDTRISDIIKKSDLVDPAIFNVEQIDKDWMFNTDPTAEGQTQKWFSTEYDDSNWHTIAKMGRWESNGFPGYDGIGWYRKWVEIPESFKNWPVYIEFGGVSDEYDIYVNGTYITHYGSAGKSSNRTLTSTDITHYIKKNAKNLICLRVNNWGGNGGMTKGPVMLTAKAGMPNVYFNLARKQDAKLWMDYHNSIMDDGVDFWWIDGDYARMDGLNSQMWTNKVYYDAQQQHTGKRTLIFSRYGGPGSHRYPAFFTGDAYSNWKTLTSEIPFTIKAGNTLAPYVTHDISGFFDKLTDDFELYARWVEFGALSPMLRLHSAHENPVEGNVRLPWVYGKQGTDLCRKFFKLRYSLIPYYYTLGRQAYETGMPIVRGLYLEYPDIEQAYRFDEYLLGESILVAPITSPGTNGTATRDIYLPPGGWVDYFSGKVYNGNQTISYECPLDGMPIFVKQGSIIPKQPDMDYTSQKPVDPLILDVYPGRSTSFTLYEDDGSSLDYKNGKFARTAVTLKQDAKKNEYTVTIGPAKGRYAGQPQSRSYLITMRLGQRPQRVIADGKSLAEGKSDTQSWQWDEVNKLATIKLQTSSISTKQSIIVQ